MIRQFSSVIFNGDLNLLLVAQMQPMTAVQSPITSFHDTQQNGTLAVSCGHSELGLGF